MAGQMSPGAATGSWPGGLGQLVNLPVWAGGRLLFSCETEPRGLSREIGETPEEAHKHLSELHSP